MGQKVNPHGLRVGVIKGWNTQWYADKKDFSKFLKEDYEIRSNYIYSNPVHWCYDELYKEE